ncbi:M23 family metallopeptidase [Halopseudomonas salegens]|uniref:Murein DD-endopeptidase MepM and murein hydrolase activator NlpD, contain LysM domain n=1 Tax=Halopseudomonas salegens TaxID=1434072 RepID=A0A1H2GR29_9GAMM|nr:M23 family metallopeptidase [Halopseudomonas salegens]SDU22060.1 Murein DD-endopeptidase MepM and murein hydrolase activator NlpD, contain LysM domain [Halopseudomonas salegens]
MNIIILTGRHGAARSLTLTAPWLLAAGFLLLTLPVMLAGFTWKVMSAPSPGYEAIVEADILDVSDEPDLQAELDGSHAQLERMTQQLARLQTRLSRLDALGQRLTELADLSDGEFDFDLEPGVGGPERPQSNLTIEQPDVQSLLEQLSARVDNRTRQLRLLEELMLTRQTDANALLDFMPVHEGYVSSGYGRRTDPISGRTAMHTGLDFAAPHGTPIYAVGAGVVTFSGRNGAYGNMVEITHGNGYTSRYAHARQLVVETGDLVQKGEEIATVGTSGRSTGPHLHLEIRRNGMAVNPARYIALR